MKTFHLSGLLTLSLLLVSSGYAEMAPQWRARPTQVIDIPTADLVDHYGYHVKFRFQKEGGVVTKTAFGVFPRLNLGFGLDGERLIGTRSASFNKPTINVKFRLFDGVGVLPALALGFDGQGYHYDDLIDKYDQREKGVYMTLTGEVLARNLLYHVGGNNFDFKKGDTSRVFGGLSYVYENTIGLLLEGDELNKRRDHRISYAFRYFLTPVFTVDLGARNVPKRPGSSARETERIVRLGYTGSF